MNEGIVAVLIAIIAAVSAVAVAFVARSRKARVAVSFEEAQARHLDAQTSDLIIARMRGEIERLGQELNTERMKRYRLINAYSFLIAHAPADVAEKAGRLLRGEDPDSATPIIEGHDV